MNKFLITNKPEKLEGKFKDVKVLNTDDFKEVAPESWSNYDYEFMPYLICENIKNTNPIIAIDFSIPDTDKYLIAHHIITSVKAFVFFFSEAEVTNLLYESDLGLFRNKFIKVITFKNLVDYFNNDTELERLNQLYNLNFDFVKYKIAFQ